jgi:hypothetical protein
MILSDMAPLRLYNQHLSQADFTRPQDVVAWLLAVQSQDYAGAKWSLGVRMGQATDAVINQAFNDGAILRTHVLRPTWHFVTPADIRWLLMLTAPRVHGVNGTMYRQVGLDASLFSRCAEVIVQALQGGKSLTRDELRGHLQQAGLDPAPLLRMTYIVMWAELEQIICSGPRRGKQFTYMLLDERIPVVVPFTREEALVELSRRYFMSRGPATVADFAKWSGLTLTEARQGLEAVKDHLEQAQIEEQTYWMPPTITLEPSTTSQAYMLSIYDEIVSGYKDRSAIGEAEVGVKLLAMGNALTNIVLLDGQIVGAFRRELKPKQALFELNLFLALTTEEYEAVLAAANRFGSFLQLPVQVTGTTS